MIAVAEYIRAEIHVGHLPHDDRFRDLHVRLRFYLARPRRHDDADRRRDVQINGMQRLIDARIG